MFKLKCGPTSLRKTLSQKNELKWAKWQWEKQFSSTWKCLILLFIVAFEKVLFSVIFCLLPPCINTPGTSLFGCISSASCQTSVGAKWWPRREAMLGNVKASHTRRWYCLAFHSSELLFMEISKSPEHLYKRHWWFILNSWLFPDDVFAISMVILIVHVTQMYS